MHKILFIKIILMSFLFMATIHSQTPKWVSTGIQSSTIVLEHFSTKESGYSADEDRIANLISKKYPDNLIIINNYIDSVKNFDLTTDEGRIIHKYAEEVSKTFPTGTLNRINWATNRNNWYHDAEYYMTQETPVNIYVKPEFNFKTCELTVEVEYYYTKNTPKSQTENYLTVMLLQNEIICYQKEGKMLNPDCAINDTLYIHNHVLRKIISSGGVWGDTITNTKKGSYGCRKYNIILPNAIKNVPLDPTKIEVVAFISSKYKDRIYTGHKANIDIFEDYKTDLAVEDVTLYPPKFSYIYPKIKVTNNSDMPVTNFDIEYTLANTQTELYSPYFPVISTKQLYDTIITNTYTYSGRLDKFESVIVEFPEITRDFFKTSSMYVIQASVSNIYSKDVILYDINMLDNTAVNQNISLIDTLFSETEINFENTDTNSTTGLLPPYAVLDHSFNSYFTLVQGALGFIHSSSFCGAKNTKAAVLFLLNDSYNISFNPGYIMFGEIDCQKNPNKILSYYYAYSDQMENGTRPRIVVDISKDLGKTWHRISEMFCDETGKISGTSEIYLPISSEEYKYVQIELSNNIKENFIVRLGCIPGTNGNVLWLDEISIKNGPYEESIKEDINLSVYPNPASNILHINNDNLLNVEYEIYDMSGKLIIKDINNTNIINVENLSTGTYSLKIKDSIYNFIKK